MYSAPRVIATMRTVVKTEARIIFMELSLGRPDAAWKRIAQPERKQYAQVGQLARKQPTQALRNSAQTGPIVGHENGIGGIGSVVLDTGGLGPHEAVPAKLGLWARGGPLGL